MTVERRGLSLTYIHVLCDTSEWVKESRLKPLLRPLLQPLLRPLLQPLLQPLLRPLLRRAG